MAYWLGLAPRICIPVSASNWIAAVPTLDTVTVWNGLCAPSGSEPKARAVGATTRPPATPVPVRVTVLLTPPRPPTVSVALTVASAVGVNTMLMVQLVCAARVAAQLPPATPAGRA